MSAQQAHHIIPVGVFNNLKKDTDLYERLKSVFGETEFHNLQQMGNNFIYLHTKQEYADRTAALLQNNPNIFGDIAVGGVKHHGSHNAYNQFVEDKIKQIFDPNLKFTPQQQKMMFLDLQRGLKEILVDRIVNNILDNSVDNIKEFNNKLDDALAKKNVYSPTNLNDSHAKKTWEAFELDKQKPDDKRFITKVFDGGDDGRNTNKLAEYHAEKIQTKVKELNEVTNFLTEESLPHFASDKIKDAAHARSIILSATYDVEKFLSSADEVAQVSGKSLTEFTNEFKETVSLTLTHNLDAKEAARLASLKDKFKINILDTKAVKLMADLKTDKTVFLDFNGVDGKTNFKNSLLWDVLDHIENSNKFDDIELNGQKISHWKTIAAGEIKDVNGKLLQKIDFKQLIYTTVVSQTNLLKAQHSEFDREKFKDLENHLEALDDKRLKLSSEQGEKLSNDFNELLDKYRQEVGGVDNKTSLQYLQKVANEHIPLEDIHPKPTHGKAPIGSKVAAGLMLLFAASTVHAASELPTVEEQKQFLIDAFFTTVMEDTVAAAAEFTVARLISAAVGAGLVTVSAPVAATAALIAGIAASIYGEDIYKLTKDLDNNGRMDFIDRMSTLMFGQDIQPNKIPEILNRQLDHNFETHKVDLNAEISVKEFIAKAKENIAYRYALQELNPFVIEGANYDALNEDGSLNLLDEQNPQGMSEQYLIDRSTMLLLQLKYLQNGLKLGRDLESYNIKGDWDYLDYGKHPFAGEPDSPLVFSIDGNGISTDDHQIAFGTQEDDTFTGSGKSDRLFGGAGNDTFVASKGDDYMEGGIGHDVYHIKDNDAIFDSDMNGQIIFDGLTKSPHLFQKTGDNTWAALSGNGTLSHITATREGNDLLIKNNDDSVLIKEFFLLAKNVDNALWNGLGLNLIEHTIQHTYESIDNTVNNFQIRADKSQSIAIIGNQYGDTVTPFTPKSVVVDGGDGKDIIYGSGQGGNIIFGGNDNDLLHGANYSIRNKDADTDIIVGGSGSDLIDGMGGKDIIYAGEIDEHLSTVSSKKKGDWVNGHLGDDNIYGSRGHDFLQGGSGSDTIYGGAGNDVILGDGDVLFQTAFKNEGATSSSIVVDPITTPVGIPAPTGIGVTEIAGSRRGIEHQISGSGADSTSNMERIRLHDDKMHQWAIKINSDGDYELSNALIRNNTHLAENGGNDILFGGAGNDLIIGQTGDDELFGDDGDDILWGDDNRDKSISGNDKLYGGNGNDILYGGKGNDLLAGGSGNNKLYGGDGFDTYQIVSHEKQHQIINDSDNQGEIQVDGIILGHLSWKLNVETQLWSANETNVTLKQNGDILQIFNQNQDEIAIIEQFQNGALGIQLNPSETETITPPTTEPKPQPNEAPTLKTEPLTISTVKENSQTQFSYADWFEDDKAFSKLKFILAMADGSALPNWVHQQNQSVNIAPDFEAAGTYHFNVTATDEEGLSNTLNWQVNVENVNRAPTVSGSLPPQTLNVGQDWQIKLHTSDWFKDADQDDKLSYHLEMADGSNLPKWLHFDDSSQILSAKPTHSGSLNLNLVATDLYNESASMPINLQINPELPQPPQEPQEETPSNVIAIGSNNHTLMGTALNDKINGGFGNDIINGLDGDDTLMGDFGDDVLNGGNGNDKLDGDFGNDVLIGGKGNDKLDGGFGNDTYIFNLGDGQDVIQDMFGDDDKLKINGLHLSDVLFTQEGRNLIIDSKINDDRITIENFYFFPKDSLSVLKPSHNFGNKIETFEFAADGQSLNYMQVHKMVEELEQANSNSIY